MTSTIANTKLFGMNGSNYGVGTEEFIKKKKRESTPPDKHLVWWVWIPIYKTNEKLK